MRILSRLALLLALCLAGDAAAAALPFAFPGSVLAMLALLALLALRAVKPDTLQPVSGFLLGNMPILFVAPMVMILDHTSILQGRAAAVLLVCTVSTLATMAAVSLTVRLILQVKGGGIDG